MPQKERFLKGQLLLDARTTAGLVVPAHGSAVICQHDTEGAFCLVLNRATGRKVGEMLVADLPELLKGNPLFLAGRCSRPP